MKKIGLLTIAVLAMLGGVAHADQPVPGRWFRLSSTFSSAPCPTGKACLWRKTDHTLHYVDDTGSDIQLGSGGGGGSVSLTCGSGLTCSPSTITGTGSVSPDSTILATLTGTQTLTNKTLTAPVLGGTATGTYTLGGTPTLSSTLLSGTAMGSGSATAFTLRTGSADAVGDRLLSIGGTGEEVYLQQLAASGFYQWRSSTNLFAFFNANGDGLSAQSGAAYFYSGGTAYAQIAAGVFEPFTNLATKLGASAQAWSTTYSRHYSGAGTAPTKAAGSCIGGTQTVTLDSNATDAAGTLTLTGTASGTASATCATVTFNATWDTAPHCQVAPANAAAAALSGTAQLFIDSASTTTSLFVVKVGSTALAAGTYLLTYDCTQ